MPDNISEILLEVGKTLGETAFMCSIALVIAIAYMLSGYYGLYSEQKIIYSKLRPQFIDRKTK